MPNGPWYELPAQNEVHARVAETLGATRGDIADGLVHDSHAPDDVEGSDVHHCQVQPADLGGPIAAHAA